MPKLITLEDGTVRWDYDVPDEKPEKPTKKAAVKSAPSTTEEGA